MEDNILTRCTNHTTIFNREIACSKVLLYGLNSITSAHLLFYKALTTTTLDVNFSLINAIYSNSKSMSPLLVL